MNTIPLGPDMQATSIATDHGTVLVELYRDGEKVASYDLGEPAVRHLTDKLAQGLAHSAQLRLERGAAA